MIDLFDAFYAANFRALRDNRWEKETDIAREFYLSQQDISNLLKGKMHFTEEIIGKICRHYKIPVAEFKKLKYTEEVTRFLKQLQMDAGTPFSDQSGKIRELELTILCVRKENRNLVCENSRIKWELKKKNVATEILSQKTKSQIYVLV